MSPKLILLTAALTLGGCFLFEDSKVDPPKNGNPYSDSTYNPYTDPKLSPEQKEFISIYAIHDSLYIYQEELQAFGSYKYSITGLYSSIKDPYTRYYDTIATKALIQQFENPEKTGMLGFSFEYLHYTDTLPDTLMVNFIYPNSPAQNMGLQKGDKILKANNHQVTGDSAKLYSEWTKGGIGTLVKLHIQRGSDTATLTGIKAEVAVPSVFVDSIAPQVSRIAIQEFSEQTLTQTSSDTSGTWKEFREALLQTKSDKATIIDLRHNPGGSVRQCLSIADEFIPANRVLLYEKNLAISLELQSILSTAGGLAENRQFVFLADTMSASCSEILLSAIRDNTSFKQVGTNTYGKGIGQSFNGTYLGGLAKVTSLQFYNKSKTPYHKIGIPPTDLETDPSKQLSKALSLVQPSLARKNFGLTDRNYLMHAETKSPILDGAYKLPKH